MNPLLASRSAKYMEKYREKIETGYCSSLPLELEVNYEIGSETYYQS